MIKEVNLFASSIDKVENDSEMEGFLREKNLE